MGQNPYPGPENTGNSNKNRVLSRSRLGGRTVPNPTQNPYQTTAIAPCPLRIVRGRTVT